MENRLRRYSEETAQELQNILHYWITNTQDKSNGGFIGKIDHNDVAYPEAPKGSVLNSRILWSFSAAYNLAKNRAYLTVAERAFDFLLHRFFDRRYGGVFWSVDFRGEPLDAKKQIYALSFAIYGASEYYRASGDIRAKALAQQLYRDIVQHSYDDTHGGYIEALTESWQQIDDLRLSAKDANERKSMNTHLHVLEGFANLYRIWPDEGLKQRITELIRLFLDHIICKDTHHLLLFFADDWTPRSNVISYGHDIEAAWLLQDAAEVIGAEDLLNQVQQRSVLIAEAAAEGLDSDGGLWYELDMGTHLVKEKHWWPQSEAMVGFFNAWQLTGNEQYLQRSLKSWAFVQQYILDKKGGEWVWGVKEDYSTMAQEDKVGLWKCPYHNSRACIEIIRRITAMPVGKPANTANKAKH